MPTWQYAYSPGLEMPALCSYPFHEAYTNHTYQYPTVHCAVEAIDFPISRIGKLQQLHLDILRKINFWRFLTVFPDF